MHPLIVLGDGTTVGEVLWAQWKTENGCTSDEPLFYRRYQKACELFLVMRKKNQWNYNLFQRFVYNILFLEDSSEKDLTTHINVFCKTNGLKTEKLQQFVRQVMLA